MSKVLKFVSKSAAVLAFGLLATSAGATPKLPPSTVANGLSTTSASASDAFPGLKAFLAMPAAQRSQVGIFYVLRIKHCDPAQVHVALKVNGKSTPLNIAGDGRITPLPTAAQLAADATVTTTLPATCTVGMKIKVFSPQGLKQDYDAQGLATGIKQGNAAMGRIAGVFAFGLPKLDRVNFVGVSDGTVTFANGQTKALPETGANGDYPAGTPYFTPSQMAGAVRIHLNGVPHAVMFDNPPK